MAGKREKPEDIVTKLRQVEVLHGQGLSMADAVRLVRGPPGLPDTESAPNLQVVLAAKKTTRARRASSRPVCPPSLDTTHLLVAQPTANQTR